MFVHHKHNLCDDPATRESSPDLWIPSIAREAPWFIIDGLKSLFESSRIVVLCLYGIVHALNSPKNWGSGLNDWYLRTNPVLTSPSGRTNRPFFGPSTAPCGVSTHGSP